MMWEGTREERSVTLCESQRCRWVEPLMDILCVPEPRFGTACVNEYCNLGCPTLSEMRNLQI